MLQVLLENLHLMCRSALVWGIHCAQLNFNPSWNPVNGDKCAELKPGECDNGWASHHIGPSIMNFREDAGIERESIQSSYHHSTVPQIQDMQ